MPEPVGNHAEALAARRTAAIALGVGVALMAAKLGIFALTGSAAVLSDALESVVNLAAAGMAIFSTWYAAKPPDHDHPYGHGNVEFIAVAVEGVLVVVAGVTIAYEAIWRLWSPVQLEQLDIGAMALGATAVALGGLAVWVWRRGLKLHSPTLVADGKHLMTDVATTSGVVVGLVLVGWTGLMWLDSVVALAVAVVVFITGGRLVAESWGGLTSRVDEQDTAAIFAILDEEVAAGRICSYHKVRYRHVGTFHWVDMHIQLPAQMTVDRAHDIASAIEHRIEKKLDRANATAHVEPDETVFGRMDSASAE